MTFGTIRTYAGPTAREIVETMITDRQIKASSGGWLRIPGVCHGSSGSGNPGSWSLSIRDGDNGVVTHCFASCDREATIRALESATGLTIWDAYERGGPDPTPDRTRRVPMHSVEIPSRPGHPARLWLATRNLWPRGAALPSGVGWMDRNNDHPIALAGSVVHAFAPIAEWMLSFPNSPTQTGFQMIHLDYAGRATVDRLDEHGITKRSIGTVRGAYTVLGDPRPLEARSVVVVEGLSDGLAVHSRMPEHVVVVTAGTSGMQGASDELLEYLAKFEIVIGCPDRDANLAGTSAWNAMRKRLYEERRVQAVTIELPDEYDDAADFAASNSIETS